MPAASPSRGVRINDLAGQGLARLTAAAGATQPRTITAGNPPRRGGAHERTQDSHHHRLGHGRRRGHGAGAGAARLRRADQLLEKRARGAGLRRRLQGGRRRCAAGARRCRRRRRLPRAGRSRARPLGPHRCAGQQRRHHLLRRHRQLGRHRRADAAAHLRGQRHRRLPDGACLHAAPEGGAGRHRQRLVDRRVAGHRLVGGLHRVEGRGQLD